MNQHVLLIGVNRHDDPEIQQLAYAVNDAQELHQMFKRSLAYGERAKLLIQPSVEEVYRTLRGMRAAVHAGDTLTFYFAGHGVELPGDGGDQLLLLGGALLRQLNEAHAPGVLSLQALIRATDDWHGVHRVWILDACRSPLHAGRSVGVPIFGTEQRLNRWLARDLGLRAGTGASGHATATPAAAKVVVLKSCAQGQIAAELKTRGRGLFSLALENAFETAGARGQAIVTTPGMVRAVGERMQAIALAEGLPADQRPWMNEAAPEVVLFDPLDLSPSQGRARWNPDTPTLSDDAAAAGATITARARSRAQDAADDAEGGAYARVGRQAGASFPPADGRYGRWRKSGWWLAGGSITVAVTVAFSWRWLPHHAGGSAVSQTVHSTAAAAASAALPLNGATIIIQNSAQSGGTAQVTLPAGPAAVGKPEAGPSPAEPAPPAVGPATRRAAVVTGAPATPGVAGQAPLLDRPSASPGSRYVDLSALPSGTGPAMAFAGQADLAAQVLQHLPRMSVGAFKPAFHEEGLFARAMDGDAQAVASLGLGGRISELHLLHIATPRVAAPQAELQGFTSARARLEYRVIDPRTGGTLRSRHLELIGRGFSPEKALADLAADVDRRAADIH